MSDDPKSRIAASVHARLLTIAKQKNEAFNLTLTRYALERFLYRLSLSAHKRQLILKGAMLFQVWSDTPHRATRDLDLLAEGEVSSEDLERKVRDICSTDAAEDGLIFDLTNLSVEEIREESRYGGVRAKFISKLGQARIPMQIDFGIGDAITPFAIETEYPTLLEMPKPEVLAYPRETVIAEKLEAIVSLGLDNSRMKDYFDLWFFATTYLDVTEDVALAVKRTFERRNQPLPKEAPIGLSDDFSADETKKRQWRSFQSRVTGATISLVEIVATIRTFAMPIFAAAQTME